MDQALIGELLYPLNVAECGSAYAGRLDFSVEGVRAAPSETFMNAVKAMADRLGIPEHRWVLAVMDHESGINPQAENPYSKAIGLIQFIKSTAKSLGTSLEALKTMSALEQLTFVEKYLRNFGRLKTATDVAAAVFYPVAIGNMGYVIGKRGQKTYDWNAALDKGNKGFITITDYMRSLRKYGWRWGIEMSDFDSYLDLTKKADSFRVLASLVERVLAENPKSVDAQAAFTRFRDTLSKLKTKVSDTTAPVYDGVDYRDLMIAKLRAVFKVPTDFTPSVKDYAQAAVQTVVDVGNKGAQVVEALPNTMVYGGLGAVAVIALGLFFRVRGKT